MGRLSEAIFDRKKLPERCLIYAGSYVPERKGWIRDSFDKWSRIKGNWMKYSYATKKGREYLLVFNVYGGAMILEVLQLLKDGDAKKLFLIGSMGGKDLPIGTLVIPTKVIDKSGLVSIDDPTKQVVEPYQDSLKKLRQVLNQFGEKYVEGETVSVPCVLHNIGHLKSFIEQRTSILGVDLETSTFYYYAQKEGLQNYALLYISDNKDHDIISQAKIAQKSRKKALKTIAHIAIKTIG
jgi:purine-nucleoside phosphorylase